MRDRQPWTREVFIFHLFFFFLGKVGLCFGDHRLSESGCVGANWHCLARLAIGHVRRWCRGRGESARTDLFTP
jgi:hypothetical protein